MPLPYERLQNSFSTTLTAAVTTTTATTIAVAGAAPGWAKSGPFRIRIDSEVMLVTGGQSTLTWTVRRGAEGSTRATHASGATVTHVVTDVGLGSVIDSTRANVTNVARFNSWGLKFRGVTPTTKPAYNGYYGRYWGTAYDSAFIANQFNQVVQLGCNMVKGIGSPWEVIDGTTSQATYLGRIEAWLDLAWKKGLFVSFLITDNLQSLDTASRATLAQEIVQAEALAALLDQYPNVVALDLINEVNGWQSNRNNVTPYGTQQPDATTLTWLTGPDSLTAAVRANTSKPLGCSLFVLSAASLLANTGADWLPLLVANFDYLDVHPYYTTGDMSLADLQSLHALYPELAVYFGEVAVQQSHPNNAAFKSRIDATRSFIEQPYVPGAIVFALNDYTANTVTDVYGMFDNNGNERTNSTYALRTWPRRSGYAGPVTTPLVTPANPVPLTTTLQPVPFAKFPLRGSYYDSSLGDPSYRIRGVASDGVLVSDSLEAQVYDLDTGVAITSKATLVPTSGGPSTADASGINASAAVLGSPTPSSVAAKFSNGIQIANTSQQVQLGTTFQPGGTQPFTAEMWIRRTRTSFTTDEIIVGQWDGGGAAANCLWQIAIWASPSPNQLQGVWLDGGGNFQNITDALVIANTTTTYHIAMSYDGTTMRFFRDGVLAGSIATTVQTVASPRPLTIGGSSPTNPATENWQGVADEFRLSNIARYTAAFTPSAAAFTADANTMALLHMDTVSASSTNLVANIGTDWQYVQAGQSINAGVKFRNATAARGAVTSAGLEVRYA